MFSSKRNQYIVILTSILLSLNNVFYLRGPNLPYILLVMVSILIPAVIVARYIYLENITLMARDVPRYSFYIIDFLILIVIANVSYHFVYASSWLLVSSDSIVNNITMLGASISAIMFFLIVINLRPNIKFIYQVSRILAVVNFIVFPIFVLWIFGSEYLGFLQEAQIGYVQLDYKTGLLFFTGIQYLFILRSNREEERKIAKALWPTLLIIIGFYVLGSVMMYTTTNLNTATDLATYSYRFIDSLFAVHQMDIDIQIFITVISLYECVRYLLLACMLYIVLDTLGGIHYDVIAKSSYLNDDEMREIVMRKKHRFMSFSFIAIIAFMAIYASTPATLFGLMRNVSLISQVLLNIIIAIIIVRLLIRNREIKLRYKLIMIFLTGVSVAALFAL